MTGGSALEIVHRTLEAIETEVLRRWQLAQVNAMLAQADPALVLPSPSVALLGVKARESMVLFPTIAFRSLEPLSMAGEALLTPVECGAEVHPWTVRDASFRATPEELENHVGRPLAPTLSVTLERPNDSAASPGWLSLFVPGGEIVRWGLSQALTYSGDVRLICRAAAAPAAMRDATASRLSAALELLESLSANLLQIEIPPRLVEQTEMRIDIFLPDGISAAALPPAPQVQSNVLPVWNSLDCRSPGFPEFSRALGVDGPRLVHPLVPVALSSDWKAWSLMRVGAAADARFRVPNYHLAYLPVDERSEDGSRSTETLLADRSRRCVLRPCVMLPREARERLDREGHRLDIAYRATQGGLVSDLPAGAEFQMIDLSGLHLRESIAGRLATASAGGSDGVLGDMEGKGIATLAALRPYSSRRTVADLMAFFERSFGQDLTLVDGRDLLRGVVGERAIESMVQPRGFLGMSGSQSVGRQSHAGRRESCVASALHVRVRFREPGRPAVEKAALLRACEALLGRYLLAQECCDLKVVEDRGGMVG